MNTIREPFGCRTIIAERPAHLPAPHWRIFNAPRPLYGHMTWKGDFVSGIFYAAVCDLAEDAEKLIELNRRDAAIELAYITEEVAVDRQVDWYSDHYPHMTSSEIVAYVNEHPREVAQSYLHRVNA